MRHTLLSTLTLGATLALPAGAQDLIIAGRDGIYGDALQMAVDAYTAENPDVAVELLKLPYANLYEKLVVSLRGGDSAYDLVLLDDTWATEFMSNGWLAELDDIDEDFIASTVDIARYPVGEGPLYAVPMVGNVEMFAYRADLFEKHELSAPESWSGLLEAARAIDAAEEGVSGAVFRGTKGNPIVTGFLPIFWAHGGEIIDAEGNAAVASEAGVQALETLLALKDVAPEGVEVYNATEVRDALQQGTAAIAIEVWPSWVPGLDDPGQSKVVGQMTIAAAPGETASPAPMLGVWLLGMAADAPHAETAQDFLEFITGAGMQKTLVMDLGLPPTRASVYSDPEVVAQYRWYPAQLDALEKGRPRPRVTNWQEIESILGDYLQLALVGQMPPAAALEQAEADIQRALGG